MNTKTNYSEIAGYVVTLVVTGFLSYFTFSHDFTDKYGLMVISLGFAAIAVYSLVKIVWEVLK